MARTGELEFDSHVLQLTLKAISFSMHLKTDFQHRSFHFLSLVVDVEVMEGPGRRLASPSLRCLQVLSVYESSKEI